MASHSGASKRPHSTSDVDNHAHVHARFEDHGHQVHLPHRGEAASPSAMNQGPHEDDTTLIVRMLDMGIADMDSEERPLVVDMDSDERPLTPLSELSDLDLDEEELNGAPSVCYL